MSAEFCDLIIPEVYESATVSALTESKIAVVHVIRSKFLNCF